MVRTSISLSIEELLLKELDDYIARQSDLPSRSSIICEGLKKELFLRKKDQQNREGRADISIIR